MCERNNLSGEAYAGPPAEAVFGSVCFNIFYLLLRFSAMRAYCFSNRVVSTGRPLPSAEPPPPGTAKWLCAHSRPGLYALFAVLGREAP